MAHVEKSPAAQDGSLAVDDASQDSESITDVEKGKLDNVEKPQMLRYDTVPWLVERNPVLYTPLSRHCRYKRVPFTNLDVPPPSGSLDSALLIPEATASIFSLITFTWITSILRLGYARPLEPTDLWKLQDKRSAAVISEKIVKSFERRAAFADEYNAKLANGEISPGWRKVWWSLKGNRTEREKKWREKDGRKKPSLALAMNDSVKWWFWSAGVCFFFSFYRVLNVDSSGQICKVIADTSQITSPLVVKVHEYMHRFLASSLLCHYRPLSSLPQNHIPRIDWASRCHLSAKELV